MPRVGAAESRLQIRFNPATPIALSYFAEFLTPSDFYTSLTISPPLQHQALTLPKSITYEMNMILCTNRSLNRVVADASGDCAVNHSLLLII